MSIAQGRYTSPRLYPVFIVPADRAQDVSVTLTATVGAPIGEVDVYLAGAGALNLDQVRDWSEYVEMLRTFARHLACYADAFEDAATLDF